MSIVKTFKKFLWICGPGIVVMLADGDAGSLITAAQTGAVWGYKMLTVQVLLIPILYLVQELTVRLGIVTGQGHAHLIKQYFGKGWAWLSVSTLLICCVGAMISQFSGLIGIGMLFGVPKWIVLLMTISFLSLVTLTGSYRSVEKCAIFIGLFELIFIVVAFLSHPSMREIASELKNFPLTNSSYLYFVAANIGAVIMPWMIFYQQSAIVDKKLKPEHLKSSRIDTAIGAIVTQTIMISMIVIAATTIGKSHPGQSLDNVQQISEAITPFFGKTIGEILFGLGMIGASLIAALVVSLAAAWSVGELIGHRHSLEHRLHEAPMFYSIYLTALILGGLLVVSGINLVKLNMGIQILNALSLPIVLGFLYLLARKTLPAEHKLKGKYAILVLIVLIITISFGLIGGIWGSLQG